MRRTALDAYLNLEHQRVFDVQDYRTQLRPDVELLGDGIANALDLPETAIAFEWTR